MLFFVISLELLEDSWDKVAGLLGTGVTISQDFCDLISEWFRRRRLVLGIL